jgi:hypothetical protein
MKTIPTIAILWGLTLTSVALAADKDDSVDQARARFYRGVELFQDGSYSAALDEFQGAYASAPTYRVLYNIAQTYFELHDYANCFRTLRDYVEQGGSEIPSSRRAKVDQLQHKLQKRIAYVDILCNLDDAELRIDDVAVGRSPLVSPVVVNPGPRKISVARPGSPLLTREVTMTDGETATVRMEIAPPAEGRVGKTSPPQAAQDELLSSTPLRAEVPASQPKASRTWLIISLTAASSSAVATGIFGWQTLLAKSEFDHEVAKTTYDRAALERLRSRTLTYEYLTEGFAAATLLSTGMALYLALTDDSGRRNRTKLKPSLAVVPAASGMIVHGVW